LNIDRCNIGYDVLAYAGKAFFLDNIKVPSKNIDALIPLLQNIKIAYGEPLAMVSDMRKGILAAIKDVFKDVPR